MWEEPRIQRYLRRLGSFSRVITFDKRGLGVSDPVPMGAMPTLEHWADDIRLVLDAVGSKRAALVGTQEGVQMALMVAALYPDRTHSVVLMDGSACYLRHDDYPIGLPERLVDYSVENMFGPTGDGLGFAAPSLSGDDAFRRWWGRFQRLSAGPTASARIYRHGMYWDARPALSSISAPTLVLHHRDNRYMWAPYGQYIAERISGARYVELPGADSLFFAGDQDATLDEIEMFLTGAKAPLEHDRVLGTVLFTDIVGSTERAATLGDGRWRGLLDLHDRFVIEHVAQFRGRVVKTTGDGVLAMFDGPARATRCARAILDAVRSLGLDSRAGLHAGEVDLRGQDIGGIAVNLAARVVDVAEPGEVLVTRTVRDLVAGSGIEFVDRGEFALRGIPEKWQLFALQG